MNVQEELLQRKIDPHIREETLLPLAEAALAGSGQTPRRVEEAGVLTGGCWNRVLRVLTDQGDLVFKISPKASDPGITREFGVLRHFREETDLPVPEPLYLDREEKYLPGTTLVMRRVPGVVMHESFGFLTPAEQAGIIESIARDLANLYDRRTSGFGGVELPPSDRYARWPDFWLPRFEAVLRESREAGVVPADIIQGAERHQPRFEAVLDIGSTATLTHYDIWSGNVMIDPDSRPPRVTGYIDVPGYYADYARELSFAMLFGVADRLFFETYLERHELDDQFWLRANIYNLKMNMKHIQMYPGAPVYQEGARENLRVLGELLA